MKILIAEDDPTTRRLLASMLTKLGHEVTETPDGEAAWEAFKAGDFPLVVTDWMMPNVDGPSLIRLIRADTQHSFVYVILLTAMDQKEDLVFGMESGADDYVTKPFDRRELRARVHQGERVVQLERSLAAQNKTLKETQAALIHREKLASLGHLATGIVHEVDHPLADITNSVAVLKRDVQATLDLLSKFTDMDVRNLRATVPERFERIQNGLERVKEIVEHLRDFTPPSDVPVSVSDQRH